MVRRLLGDSGRRLRLDGSVVRAGPVPPVQATVSSAVSSARRGGRDRGDLGQMDMPIGELQTVRAMVAGRDERRIRLSDGRWLGFADYGDPQGMPLFAFHGTPGSRLMVEAADRPARAAGVRLIAPDRPGFGLSCRRPGRRIADWPQDVVELADQLGIDRFGVVGVSGGGPYALACAWRIPERLTIVASISGVAPMTDAGGLPGLRRQDHMALEVVRLAPWLGRSLMALCGRGWRRTPERMYRRLLAFCPPADRALLERPEVTRALVTGVQEAFRHGTEGPAEELRLLIRPWGFALGEITLPVYLWHGDRDTLVPCAALERLAGALPRRRVEVVPGGGHYLVYEMMESLLALLRREVAADGAGAARRMGVAAGD
jgi:pimeloyl-ACP methyl ester carboxylesterase